MCIWVPCCGSMLRRSPYTHYYNNKKRGTEWLYGTETQTVIISHYNEL